jgi:ADP-dependent NAD(P)H-hydrate dehydratase / NAD(P)H-hydrate epimerase
MAAVTRFGMRAAEGAAIAVGWTEEQLVDLAGTRLGHALGRFFPQPGSVIGYLGKGHNAGDTLVALRVLREDYGWQIATRSAFSISECASLTQKKWSASRLPSPLEGPPPWRDLKQPVLLLDGLVGIGAQGALRDPLLKLASEMEWLRQHAGARVAAVDLPSGVDPDTGEATPGAVTADITFMIGNPKAGLLMSPVVNSVGSLALVPLEVLAAPGHGEIALICPQEMDFGKSPRPYDFHKGMAGRVSVIAGSDRYPGAAVLAATGALRGGAGLVTLHVPINSAAMVAAKCPPEIIVRGFSSPREVREVKCDAMVIGCGLGDLDPAFGSELLDWLDQSTAPAVIDADALNLIAKSGRWEIFKDQHVLTPHPGEFARLAPDLAGLSREAAARAFANRTPATLLLKGGRTLIACAGQPLWCNATGSPGMATGGQGDLLAGAIGARLAGGDPHQEGAALGAWLCGRASEIALNHPEISEESLTPSDTALHLGAALQDWKSASR